jgi:hypothetical protein
VSTDDAELAYLDEEALTRVIAQLRKDDSPDADELPRILERTIAREMATSNGLRGCAESVERGGDTAHNAQPRSDSREWPEPLAEAAFHGLAGDVVRAIEPHSEADPIALLIVFLAQFGSLIGAGAHDLVGETRHPARLFPVLVGKTAKGRKGEAQSQVDAILGPLDPDWAKRCRGSGLASGEGVIFHVRDAVWKKLADKSGEVVEVLVDEGVTDKRLIIVEAEFGRTLRVGHRDGNTLSPVVRDAWDDKPLRNMTKNNPLTATGAHVTIVGHITVDELVVEMTSADLAYGYANRFLFACVQRSKLLARPARMPADVRRALQERIGKAVGLARTRDNVPLSSAAAHRWDELYMELSEERPGMLGALTARAEPYVLRIALIYALLECESEIGPQHLAAAIALWQYVERSLAYVFGDMTGDPVADQILRALRNGPLSRNDIRDLFDRHKSARQLDVAIDLLVARRLVVVMTEATAGRSRTLYACAKSAKRQASAAS